MVPSNLFLCARSTHISRANSAGHRHARFPGSPRHCRVRRLRGGRASERAAEASAANQAAHHNQRPFRLSPTASAARPDVRGSRPHGHASDGTASKSSATGSTANSLDSTSHYSEAGSKAGASPQFNHELQHTINFGAADLRASQPRNQCGACAVWLLNATRNTGGRTCPSARLISKSS